MSTVQTGQRIGLSRRRSAWEGGEAAPVSDLRKCALPWQVSPWDLESQAGYNWRRDFLLKL